MEVIRFSKRQHIQKQAEKMSSSLLTFSHNGKFPLFTLRRDGYVRAFSRQSCAFGSLGFPSSLSRRRRRCRHRCLKSLLIRWTRSLNAGSPENVQNISIVITSSLNAMPILECVSTSAGQLLFVEALHRHLASVATVTMPPWHRASRWNA